MHEWWGSQIVSDIWWVPNQYVSFGSQSHHILFLFSFSPVPSSVISLSVSSSTKGRKAHYNQKLLSYLNFWCIVSCFWSGFILFDPREKMIDVMKESIYKSCEISVTQ